MKKWLKIKLDLPVMVLEHVYKFQIFCLGQHKLLCENQMWDVQSWRKLIIPGFASGFSEMLQDGTISMPMGRHVDN